MRINRVDAFLLSYPLPEPLHLTYHGGNRVILKRDAMLIRVETDTGVVGYAPGQGSEQARDVIQSEIAPFLKGHVLADCDALRVKFLATGDRSPAAIKYFACVEIALYDALGKHRGIPVSELLGGRVRDRIRLYGSGGMYMPPDQYAAEAKAIAEQGFLAYKMRPGMGPEQDLETVRRIRESLGPDIDIMVDAHTWWRMGNKSYDVETVANLARRLAEYDIYWLEEPVQPDNHDALRQLREADIVPIASGEHEPGEEGYLDLINRQCADFIQMDIVCQGGYGLAKRLFGELEKNQLRFAFHSWGTELEVIAAAHIGICWPETVVEWLEYPCHRYPGNETNPLREGMYPFDLAHEILKTRLTIENGDLVVPVTPGLGVEVDESVIEKYPWIPGPWSRFELIDPPGSFAVTSDHTVKWDKSVNGQ
jgi:L-alanine-DL-glutamate epimerase-like enolase superfamily enzyme